MTTCVRVVATSFLLFWCHVAVALEYKPYPEAQITVEQWESYYHEALEKFGTTAREYAQQHLVVVHDQDTRTHYAFTLPGHAVYPAWITRRVIEKNGEVFIDQIGYFAGAEEPFAELFQAYLDLNEKMKADMRRQQGTEEE